jgi:hypothetical protein
MMALAPRTVQNIPGAFQPRSDDGLAAGFNHSRADEEPHGAKSRIVHPAGVGRKVLRLFSAAGSLGWSRTAISHKFSAASRFEVYAELSHLRIFAPHPEYHLAMKCLATPLGEEVSGS